MGTLIVVAAIDRRANALTFHTEIIRGASTAVITRKIVELHRCASGVLVAGIFGAFHAVIAHHLGADADARRASVVLGAHIVVRARRINGRKRAAGQFVTTVLCARIVVVAFHLLCTDALTAARADVICGAGVAVRTHMIRKRRVFALARSHIAPILLTGRLRVALFMRNANEYIDGSNLRNVRRVRSDVFRHVHT